MGRFDEARRLVVVVQRLADLANGHLENGVADEGVRPHRADQVLFGDELPRTPQQVFEHGERLGPELDGLRALPQALTGQVECEGLEVDATFVQHEYLPQPNPNLTAAS